MASPTLLRPAPAPDPRFPAPAAPVPAWPRWCLLALLAGTAVLYLWGLGASGWANAYYSAAAQAGATSWRAWFFGASDAPGLIMIDKPPASVWVMGLSARLFGVNAWAILVPQALMGVASVGLLHATVRRWAGPAAGLVAGLVLALTPVATLMFRFDNPDALLVLLLVAAAWALTRAVDADTPRGAWRWLALTAVLVGTGFLTKSLQAFLVLPAFAAVWLLAGPGRVRGRLLALLPTAAVLAVASGWWVAVVELWPASSRPYVGGSQTNSAVELLLGYNGLGRLTGDETGSVGPGGGGGGGGRSSGSVLQLVTGEMASQVSWLLPAALLLLAALIVITVRAPRTDRTRAAAILWGGTLLVTAAVFTLSQGIIHSYYAVALAPPIAALVGIGAVTLARRRDRLGRVLLTVTVAVTAVWSWALLRETPTFLPWLRAVVLVGGLVVALGLLVRAGRVVVTAVLAGALVVGVAGPAASSVVTAATTHEGALPTAGPESGRGPGGPGGPGGGPGRGAGGPGFPDGGARGGPGGAPPGGAPMSDGGGRGSGMMTLLQASRPSAALTTLLRDGAAGHTWVAAAVGSNAAAGYQLASGAPVMALGGFNGTDPAPTLAQFQAYVATGAVHWFVGDESSASISTTDSGGSDDAARIAAWVAAHYTATTVGGTTVYDLTAPAGV
ncbi:ArnT family glycosyltransferase [Actinomycetospora flava]|uniref:Glycosyltransferase family 39 protein n=1 Tax=Actinomycetospora flava TaxID=3129232 RepID=A0ABU8M2Q6_9PSEU